MGENNTGIKPVAQFAQFQAAEFAQFFFGGETFWILWDPIIF